MQDAEKEKGEAAAQCEQQAAELTRLTTQTKDLQVRAVASCRCLATERQPCLQTPDTTPQAGAPCGAQVCLCSTAGMFLLRLQTELACLVDVKANLDIVTADKSEY